jgi:hypothetical protein
VIAARALDLPAAINLFAIGSTVGWIGHAIDLCAINLNSLNTVIGE